MLSALSAACAKEPSRTVHADVVTYGREFQTKLAGEMEAAVKEKPVCPRDGAGDYCLAWPRAIIDYGHSRDQTRAIVGPKTPEI